MVTVAGCGKSDCSNLTVGKVYGSLWSSSSAEGLGSQSGESRSMGMAWMRSSLGGRGRAKNGYGRVEYHRVKLDDRLRLWANGKSRCSPGLNVAAMCLKMDSMTVLKWLSKEIGAGSCDGCGS